jgi:hypothetical protein
VRYYVAARLETAIEVVSNAPFLLPGSRVALKWSEGQIGALPVFHTEDAALAYANGAGVVAIDTLDAPRTERVD